jgi:transposase
MRIRVSLRKGEKEALFERLHRAYAKGEVRLIRRIHVLLYFFEGKPVAEIAEWFKLSEQTVYNYVKAFILNRLDSLVYKRPPGRAPKLSKTQKEVLAKLIERGPEAAGYDCGCWDTTLMFFLK